jgi:hypothetical protein
MTWFKDLFKDEMQLKTDEALQAELRALVERLVAQQRYSVSQMDRYEKFLQEIYKRGLTPEVTLITKE